MQGVTVLSWSRWNQLNVTRSPALSWPGVQRRSTQDGSNQPFGCFPGPAHSSRSRMLKKSASCVLASLRGATLRRGFSEAGSTVGAFPFAKIHPTGERPTRSAVCTSSPLRSLRPCWTDFLSILRGRVLFSQTCGALYSRDFRRADVVFPQPAMSRG